VLVTNEGARDVTCIAPSQQRFLNLSGHSGIGITTRARLIGAILEVAVDSLLGEKNDR
jgi:hypothetical protein